MKIQKPFTYRHGESTFEKYTEAVNMGTALIHDPDNLIQWENGADIQGRACVHVPVTRQARACTIHLPKRPHAVSLRFFVTSDVQNP